MMNDVGFKFSNKIYVLVTCSHVACDKENGKLYVLEKHVFQIFHEHELKL
jgi:hypothetical protein